jgi:AcrR family transcriptional regulator
MRLDILRAAAAAFRRRGYHGASVDQIARALHMTKGNLYYYFKNKEEILYVCHDYALDQILRELRTVDRSGAPPDEKLRRLIGTFVHMFIDVLHASAWTLVVEALSPPLLKKIIAKRDRIDRAFRRILDDGASAGVLRVRDAKLQTFAILGAINWIPRWYDSKGPATSGDIARVFAGYLVDGLLAGSAGRARETRVPLVSAAGATRPRRRHTAR